MHHQPLDYFDGQQKLSGELFYHKNQSSDKRPAIIVFHALEGRNEFALNYAENLAKQGYITLAADMYGDAAVGKNFENCFQLITPFQKDRSLVRKRALLAYSAIKNLPMVDNNKIGAIGFCFGGMCVLEVARSGENLAAGVSIHGVLTKSDLPTESIKSKLLILHGYRDPQAPPDCLQKFATEMDAAGSPDWVFTFFSHAKHSFSEPKAGAVDPAREREMGREYNQLAAQYSFRYALDFFAQITNSR